MMCGGGGSTKIVTRSSEELEGDLRSLKDRLGNGIISFLQLYGSLTSELGGTEGDLPSLKGNIL